MKEVKLSIEKKMLSWITLSKKYGAIFQNINLVYNNESFTIETIEENKNFKLYIPSIFLINIDDIVITDTKHYIKDDLVMQDDIRVMLNEYFDFIFSTKRIKFLKSLLSEFIDLPLGLKNELASFNFGTLFIENSDKDLKNRLIRSRLINRNDKEVFMPFLDFANHNFYDNCEFQIKSDAIFIQGIATNKKEIFTMYNRMVDSFGYLQTYMFIPKAINAISMNFAITNIPDLQISIVRNINKLIQHDKNLILPYHYKKDNQIIIKFLWIGSLHRPLKPYQSFQKLWEDELHRTDTQRAYSIIKRIKHQKT